MVDIVLMNQLLKAIPTNCSLLRIVRCRSITFSSGPGLVLANIIDSKQIAISKLTEIFRQAATSQITNAHKINAGKLPNLINNTDISKTDFYFING